MVDKVVETLYGSDLDSGRHGSGFPLPAWRALPTQRVNFPRPSDERGHRYAAHPWNINNMPRSVGSVLRYIEADELTTGGVGWGWLGQFGLCWAWVDNVLFGHGKWVRHVTGSALWPAGLGFRLVRMLLDTTMLCHDRLRCGSAQETQHQQVSLLLRGAGIGQGC